MDWQTLLSTEKLMVEEEEPRTFQDYPINEFEKDYNKIVSSAGCKIRLKCSRWIKVILFAPVSLIP